MNYKGIEYKPGDAVYELLRLKNDLECSKIMSDELAKYCERTRDEINRKLWLRESTTYLRVIGKIESAIEHYTGEDFDENWQEKG